MEQTDMKIFDSHELYNNLVHGGFNEKQANAIVQSIVKVNFQDISHLSTKEQLNNVKTELQKDAYYIKQSMATKEDLASTRAEFSSMKYDILKWTLPFVLGNTIAILGIIVALFFR